MMNHADGSLTANSPLMMGGSNNFHNTTFDQAGGGGGGAGFNNTMDNNASFASGFKNRSAALTTEELRKARESRAAEALKMKDDQLQILSQQNANLLKTLDRVSGCRVYFFWCVVLTNCTFFLCLSLYVYICVLLCVLCVVLLLMMGIVGRRSQYHSTTKSRH